MKERECSRMPIYRRCGRCGKRIQSGSKCECLKERYKEYDRFSRDRQSKTFYSSKQWQKKREEILMLDDGIDLYLYATRGEIRAASAVHHIEPLRECREKALEANNLISLSEETHAMIEQLYKKSPESKEKIKKELKRILNEHRSERRGGI